MSRARKLLNLIEAADYLQIVNKTARSAGAVGKRAIVPRYVASIATPSDKILDYGAGPKAIHTEMLRNQGLDVTAWEIGKNFVKGVHDINALKRTYDIVYASNVLNVQPSKKYIEKVVSRISKLVRPGGKFVCNYPISPRKSDVSAEELIELLIKYFRKVERCGGTKKAPLLVCFK